MSKIQLQRQGVAETYNASLPNGDHVQISYHHGGKYFFVDRSYKGRDKNGRPGSFREHIQLKASTLSGAVEAAAKRFRVEFDSEIEAYMYSNSGTLRAYPRVATDVYFTVATYEPGTDTIRHEPSNVCLIDFGEESEYKFTDGKASHFSDGANRKYQAEIEDAIGNYNSNIAAHGEGDERKEWLAWLVSEYIKKNHKGEKPKRLQSIRRQLR